MADNQEIVQLLAYKKAYLHSLRYITEDVIGILVGKIDGTNVSVVDAYPLFHSKTLAPTLESALDIIEGFVSEQGLKIVGVYEAPLGMGEDITIQSGEIAQKILEKIFEINHIEAVYIKVFDLPAADDENQDNDNGDVQVLTSIVSKLAKKGEEFQFKKVYGSGQCMKYFEQIKQNIENGDHRRIVDFDSHFEDISLDFSNGFLN